MRRAQHVRPIRARVPVHPTPDEHFEIFPHILIQRLFHFAPAPNSVENCLAETNHNTRLRLLSQNLVHGSVNLLPVVFLHAQSVSARRG
jgi:hypothetical protein